MSYTEFSYSGLEITTLTPSKRDVDEQNLYRRGHEEQVTVYVTKTVTATAPDSTTSSAVQTSIGKTGRSLWSSCVAFLFLFLFLSSIYVFCFLFSLFSSHSLLISLTLQSTSLHNPRYNVQFNIHNDGDVAGYDVPQLYLSFPDWVGEPPKILKGFERIWVEAGATQNVSARSVKRRVFSQS